jgi:hypothetical protein
MVGLVMDLTSGADPDRWDSGSIGHDPILQVFGSKIYFSGHLSQYSTKNSPEDIDAIS